jgi:2,4-dienoyl-CoA reductase-like NADH-dependent reductase (Old Yellow Enzyme family)/thioredoxin reductase
MRLRRRALLVDMLEIFEPKKIGDVEVPNRLVLPAMAMNVAYEGYVTREVIRHYTKFAENGVGLIIVEGANVDPKSKDLHNGLAIFDDKFCAGLNELAEEIKLRGSRVAIQLLHAGGCTTPRITGNVPRAPSRMEYTMFMHGRHSFKYMANELSLQEIKELVERFVESAGRAKDCGYDFVEINGAHGWIFSQFLSPNTNKRTDSYGGPFENRMRFAMEVVEGIRERVGIPIIFRMEGSFPSYGGVSDEELVMFAKELEKAGVSCLHVSGSFAILPTILPRGYLLQGAERVKKNVKVPVIAVGGIDAAMAVEVIKRGIDFVAIGRAMLADPELPRKLREGRIEDIRPCTRCNDCIDRVFSLRQLSVKCAVNPELGRDVEIKPARERKRIVVVGGGPAGMEFARVARLKGHDVILCEASSELGGNLIAASVPDFKADHRKYLEWLKAQIKKVGVEVKLNFRVDAERLKELGPDLVVVAIGSEPKVPEIPGIEKAYSAVDVLLNKVKIGRKVVILGGGRVGCELALHIAKDRDVTILEVLPDVALDLERNYRFALLRELKRAGVKWICNFVAERVEGNYVVGRDGSRVEFETLVYAIGMKPRKFERIDLPVPIYYIGDCVAPRKVFDAVHEAYQLALLV